MRVFFKLQIVLGFCAGGLALLFAFPAAMSAPFHSPHLAEQAYCESGEQLVIEEATGPSYHPGAKAVWIECVDAAGARTPVTARMRQAFPALIGRFFLLAFGGLFVPCTLLAWMWARRKMKARSSQPG